MKSYFPPDVVQNSAALSVANDEVHGDRVIYISDLQLLLKLEHI